MPVSLQSGIALSVSEQDSVLGLYNLLCWLRRAGLCGLSVHRLQWPRLRIEVRGVRRCGCVEVLLFAHMRGDTAGMLRHVASAIGVRSLLLAMRGFIDGRWSAVGRIGGCRGGRRRLVKGGRCQRCR